MSTMLDGAIATAIINITINSSPDNFWRPIPITDWGYKIVFYALFLCGYCFVYFFNTALCRSAFSAASFGKLVFRFSVLSVFFVLNEMFWIKTLKYVISCYAIFLLYFVLTLYRNSPFINTKLFIKIILCNNMLSDRSSH